jgi:hypothetical protein
VIALPEPLSQRPGLVKAAADAAAPGSERKTG